MTARQHLRAVRRAAPRLAGFLVIAAILAGIAGVAAARPGGGESYSGGGGHGRSSGGDGGGAVVFQLVYWIFQLLFAYPVVGVPLLLAVIGYIGYHAYLQQQNKDWDSGPRAELHEAIEARDGRDGRGDPDANEANDLGELRRLDPAFSQVVFEDFAFRLFATAHRARHTAEALATVAPYVGPAARAELAARAPVGAPVQQVVVGALRTIRVELPAAPAGPPDAPGRARITVEFEANVATADRTTFSVETWQFGRAATATSKPPGAARTFPCPNCGAPWQATHSGTQVCASCGQAVDNGRFDWVVEQIALDSAEDRPPTLTTEVPERGTDLPTYRHADLDAAWQALTADDPQLTEPALGSRLAMIYARLNEAWSNNELEPVRGLVSDGLYDYLAYWIDAYRRQGLRNVLAGMRITQTELARVARDRYFDAVTIRIWGTGKDYVIREPGGSHVRGSPRRDRAYSEYWTLIRSAGRHAAPVATPACSNCGAPLRITRSGACEHCGAHVTSGEFDWVVSKIEQDDSFRG